MYDVASQALDDALSPIYLMGDDGGLYTDSFSFIDLIPECTNISVGYMNQHTVAERQDARFLVSMAEASVNIAWEDLPTEIDMDARDDLYPVVSNRYYGSSKGRYGYSGSFVPWYEQEWRNSKPISAREVDADDLIDAAIMGNLSTQMVRDYVSQQPDDAADLLHSLLLGEAGFYN